MSDSVRPHRWKPTSLPSPCDSPGKNTGVGCHFLLQCMKVKSEREVAQSCPTLSDPMDCSPPGSSIHGIFQARVLEWDAIAFSTCWEDTELIHWRYLDPHVAHRKPWSILTIEITFRLFPSVNLNSMVVTNYKYMDKVHLWRRQWHPTPVFLPGESQGRGSLVGCRLWGHTELDTNEVT